MKDIAWVRWRWLLPLLFFQAYLGLTVLLFFAGPWPWEPNDPWELFAYLVASQAVIAVGYVASWPRVGALAESPTDADWVDERAVGFVRIAIITTLVILVPTSLSRTGHLLPNAVEGVLNAGAVYNANIARLEKGNPFVVVEYLRMLVSPLLVGLLPLTVVYWSRLSCKLKLGALLGIFFHLSLYLATGTNKGIADFAVTLPWLILLGVSIGTLRLPVSGRTIALALGALFVAFLAFFGAGQTQREGGVGEEGVFNTGFSIIEADRSDKSLSSRMGESQRIVYESLARYVGQGYYALSMTMDIPHASTLGFGNSMFLARNADAIFGTDYFTAGSLPGLLEEQTGWSMQGLWHSIYPWLASDFGFAGALVALGLFAYLLGRSWGSALLHGGHWPVIMVYLLLVLFFYIPANNQILQTAETCVAFFIALGGWIFTSLSRINAAQVDDGEADGSSEPA
ncbi:hypothetical protein HHL11_28770 [Ramlibacter sp. G-1-2-2]|uniref:Oligosaccharide repeat unit polymerase n=1 Tax=Ramlibacter agri TaxID=2728837 RepID=A0A848H9T7_9BURK|nr:hypothetical protein [Ramlibacter agri]NML47776.1 hypothetical protein [Ramlibacter agri]